MNRPRIFISYARDDAEEAKQLCRRLSKAGFETWLDQQDLLGGEEWEQQIQREIKNSDFVLVCLSPQTVSEAWNPADFQIREVNLAQLLLAKKSGSHQRLIPLKFAECEPLGALERHLRGYQWINYFETEGWAKLLQAIEQSGQRAQQRAETSEHLQPYSPLNTTAEQAPAAIEQHQPEAVFQKTAWIKIGSSMLGGGFLGATLGSSISTIAGIVIGLGVGLYAAQRDQYH